MIGKRYGFLLLQLLIEMKIDICHALLEKEFDHEEEKYIKDIIALCAKHNIPWSEDLSQKNLGETLGRVRPDYLLVSGYRRIIQSSVIQYARYGAVAVHYAMLPSYRGFAPVHWAIINGETQTGVTMFYLNEETDGGDIIRQEPIEINPLEDINAVMEKCNTAALRLWKIGILDFEAGKVSRISQDHTKATYTCARSPQDGLIDWNQPVEAIYNLIRALTRPYPCAFTYYQGKRLRILSAQTIDVGNYVGRIPGKIVQRIKNTGVVALAGTGALLVEMVCGEDNIACSADQVVKSVREKFSAFPAVDHP